MRVRKPGVHRGEADLRAVSDQDEQIGQRDQRRIHFGGALLQRGPGHVVDRAQHEAAAPIKQNGAKQRQADAGRNDNDVFPCRLDALGGALEAHQKRAHERGQFDDDPVEARIVHDGAQQDRQRET